MRNIPENIGLWIVLPPEVYKAAIEHADRRMREATRRKAQYKWYGTYGELLDNHIGQSLFERGFCLAAGITDPKRINTDHDWARVDLPGEVGAWPRACKRSQPKAYLNGQLKDWGVLVGGRVHDNEEVKGVRRCVVEVRAWASMEWVRKHIKAEDVGERGRPFYQVFWTEDGVEPIRTLVERFQLDTSACLPEPPPGISDWIDFAPKREEKIQCSDGCPDRRPSAAGGYVCNVCGFYLFR
jgi:hypothetical protein